ncbi:MAG: hypothetical protein AB1696_21275 [Planctomycetota bacterium]
MWFFRRKNHGENETGAKSYFVGNARSEGLTLKCIWCGKRIDMFVGPKAKGTIYGLCLECRTAVLAARSRFHLQQAGA